MMKSQSNDDKDKMQGMHYAQCSMHYTKAHNIIMFGVYIGADTKSSQNMTSH